MISAGILVDDRSAAEFSPDNDRHILVQSSFMEIAH
jgi:hypothetical protein